MGPAEQDRKRREFEETALVHMQSIYNAALRLVRNKTEAVREGVFGKGSKGSSLRLTHVA